MPAWVIPFIITTIIAAGLSYAIAYLQQKKPKDIHNKPDVFQLPEIDEGTKFGIIFGTCWIENPLVGWFGDIKIEEIGIRLTDTGGQYVYLNKYYYGALHILAQGVCDGIIQIKVGDLVVWPDSQDKTSFNADGASVAEINLPELYGGIHEHDANLTGEGGVIGDVDLTYGETTQTINTYLASVLGSNIPANRGLTCAVQNQVYVGLSPNLYYWKYLVKRNLHLTTGETQWYSTKAAIRTYEINPAHIIRECYTNTEWGLGMGTDLFNETAWQGVADDLYDENFGMCIKWEGDQSLDDFILDILRYINAVIYQDHSTSEIVLKLIRDDYTVGDLEEFDDSDIIKVDNFTRGVMHKTPDSTYVEYWNLIDNLPITTVFHDVALSNSQNENYIPNDVSFTGIINDTLANQLAVREQNQLSSFLAAMEITAKRTMAHLKPGDVFKLTWPVLGIDSMVVRIFSVDYGSLTNNEVKFRCAEDIFKVSDSVYSPPPSTGWGREDDEDSEDIMDFNNEPTKAIAEATGVDPTVTIYAPLTGQSSISITMEGEIDII